MSDRFMKIATCFVLLSASILSGCGGGSPEDTPIAAPSGTGSTVSTTTSTSTGTSSTGSTTTSSSTSTADVTVSFTNPSDYTWDTLVISKNVYIDRTYTYSVIPGSYENSLVLQTANNDKASTNSAFISFDIDTPTTVFVAHANNSSAIPTWLADWADTGELLISTDRAMRIYSKDFTAGTVVLGGNEGASSMYTVFLASKGTTGSTGTGTATVSWTPPTTNDDGTSLSDLAGYKIYYGTSIGSYTNTINISNTSISTHVIDTLSPGTYYFVVTAYDAAGNESAYSNMATKVIP